MLRYLNSLIPDIILIKSLQNFLLLKKFFLNATTCFFHSESEQFWNKISGRLVLYIWFLDLDSFESSSEIGLLSDFCFSIFFSLKIEIYLKDKAYFSIINIYLHIHKSVIQTLFLQSYVFNIKKSSRPRKSFCTSKLGKFWFLKGDTFFIWCFPRVRLA